MDKSPDAFRTISEVAEWLDVPAHVLRFWESRFTQVKPVKRAGGRRYYRRQDVELLDGIRKLLHEDGLTIRTVQQKLREEGVRAVAALSRPADAAATSHPSGAEALAATLPEAVRPPAAAEAHDRAQPGTEAAEDGVQPSGAAAPAEDVATPPEPPATPVFTRARRETAPAQERPSPPPSVGEAPASDLSRPRPSQPSLPPDAADDDPAHAAPAWRFGASAAASSELRALYRRLAEIRRRMNAPPRRPPPP